MRIAVGFNTMGLWTLTKGMVIHILVYDHVPGRSIHMDSMYLDVQSRHGDWYCAPGWDDCTGYLDGIFMCARSEAGDKIIEFIQRVDRFVPGTRLSYHEMVLRKV